MKRIRLFDFRVVVPQYPNLFNLREELLSNHVHNHSCILYVIFCCIEIERPGGAVKDKNE